MGLLVPVLETPRIQAVCEYSEQTEYAEWTISYSGGRYDVTSTDNDLALAVVKGVAERIEYAWNENEAMPNNLKMKVRQD